MGFVRYFLGQEAKQKVLHTHALTDPKWCGVGLLDEDNLGSEEGAYIRICWRDRKRWKRAAGSQDLFGHVGKTSCRPSPLVLDGAHSSLLPAHGKAMHKRERNTSLRNALAWGAQQWSQQGTMCSRSAHKGALPKTYLSSLWPLDPCLICRKVGHQAGRCSDAFRAMEQLCLRKAAS